MLPQTLTPSHPTKQKIKPITQQTTPSKYFSFTINNGKFFNQILQFLSKIIPDNNKTTTIIVSPNSIKIIGKVLDNNGRMELELNTKKICDNLFCLYKDKGFSIPVKKIG